MICSWQNEAMNFRKTAREPLYHHWQLQPPDYDQAASIARGRAISGPFWGGGRRE